MLTRHLAGAAPQRVTVQGAERPLTHKINGICKILLIPCERLPQRERGYTLLELLAAMSITAVLAAVALPISSTVTASYRRQYALQELTANIRRARDEAAAQGARATLAIAADGRNYSLYMDYPPYALPPEPDRLLFRRELPEGIVIEPAQSFVFDSRGFLIDNSGAPTSAAFSLLYRDSAYAAGQIRSSGITYF